MRVIAGSRRGATLRAPRGNDVRPTSDRVREALFSILVDVTGNRVLDLFAGSGALGEVLALSARRFLATAREGGRQYDLVFIDPPYRQARALGPELSAALPLVLDPEARVVVESDRRAPLELELPLTLERRYGDTLIRIHEPR